MKSDFIKYVFIVFIIAIIFAVIYKINKDEGTTVKEPITTKVNEGIAKEITLGVAEFDTMNPVLSQNKHIQEISKIIFEPLLELDKEYKIQKCLAKDWAKTSETTYLVKIRDDIKWSNGTQLMVEDVIFTIETLKKVASIYASNVQNITNVEKVDNETIKITLNQENPFFEYNLIFPIINKVNYEQNNIPIGTGKYKIVQEISSQIVLNKNEHYSREELTLEKITISKYENLAELYNAFKLGKIDVITTDNINIEDYIGTIGYNVQEVAGRKFEFLALNTKNSILSNPEVRNAISHAINKENIVNTLYNNKYKITNYPLDYGSWLKGGDGDFSYNPDLAKKILEENGWQFKYNKWQKTVNYSTKKLSFKIVVQASNQTRITVAEMLKTDLEAIGIKVSLIKVNDSQYQKYLQNKNYDSIIMETTMSISPNLETYFGKSNYANFSNEELDNLMNEVKNITREELLKEKYTRIREIFNEQIPYIGLYSSYYCVASNWSLRGSIPANWYNIFIDINNWYKNF